MKTEMVRFNAADRVELQGLYFTAEPLRRKKCTIVHMHGLAGNFYENRFVDVMARVYTENGYDFLTFNNRGHDYMTDIVKHNDNADEYLSGGAAYETFSDCIFDIEGAIKYAEGKGANQIILQGHSSGCNKIVYYLSQKKADDRISSIVLISPCDDMGLHLDAVGEEQYQSNLQLAKTMMQNSCGEQLMPEGTLFSYPICARAYYGSFQKNALQDVFPYRDNNNKFCALNNMKIPVLILFGTEDLLLQPFEEIAETVFAPHKNFSAYSIQDASHSYTGKEKELVQCILNWLLSNE